MKNLLHAIALIIGILVVGCSDEPSTPSQAEPAADSVSSESIEQALTAAHQYMASYQLEEAQAILVTLVDRAPKEVRARELYGQVLILLARRSDESGDSKRADEFRKQAYEQYAAAVDLDPNSAGLQHSAGMIAAEAGDVEAALRHFQSARRLDPDNPQYSLFEAQLLIQKKLYDDAQIALERVIELDSDEAIAHASLAMIELERKNFDEAITHIAEARRIEPGNVGLRAQEARIHRRAGDPRRALELLVGLPESDRALELVTFEIAAAYEAEGDHLAAARSWEVCFRKAPLDPRAWLTAVRIGEQLAKAGERDQAWMWLQQAQAAAPDAPEVRALAVLLNNSDG